MAAAPQAGMKKRQIIANSNKTMLVWVAGMSAVLGVCAVLSMFLVQHIVYKNKVLSKLNETSSILKMNIKTSDKLLQEVRVLNTNEALASVKARPDDKALQVILDALPADPNSLALGASLQQSLLSGVPGVTIESLAVESVNTNNITTSEIGQIPFTLVVNATDANALKDMLLRIEKSIRTIDIESMILEKSEQKYTMTLNAHAYYLPGSSVQLTDVVVPVTDKKTKKGAVTNEKK
ncbi:MAG: hypothetical protein WAQ25_01015 [Candidatus Saccharimonas sp.]